MANQAEPPFYLPFDFYILHFTFLQIQALAFAPVASRAFITFDVLSFTLPFAFYILPSTFYIPSGPDFGFSSP